jgi:hypothetical protein
MDWELTDVNMEVNYVIAAYIVVFIIAVMTVKK